MLTSIQTAIGKPASEARINRLMKYPVFRAVRPRSVFPVTTGPDEYQPALARSRFAQAASPSVYSCSGLGRKSCQSSGNWVLFTDCHFGRRSTRPSMPSTARRRPILEASRDARLPSQIFRNSSSYMTSSPVVGSTPGAPLMTNLLPSMENGLIRSLTPQAGFQLASTWWITRPLSNV